MFDPKNLRAIEAKEPRISYVDGTSATYENVIKSMGLVPVRLLSSNRRDSCITYLVKGPKGYETVKLPKPGEWAYGMMHIDTESRVLEVVGEMQGLPRKIDLHDLRGELGVVALRKEYVEGRLRKPFERLSKARRSMLEAIITRLHRIGVALVDLDKPENVVVGKEGLHVVDLGGAVFRYDFDFEETVEANLRAVNKRLA